MKNREDIYIYISLVILSILVVVYLVTKEDTPRVIQPEYSLEIINQDSVVIQNIESGKTYNVHIDSIQATLQTDNI